MESKLQTALKYIVKSILFVSLFVVFVAFYVPGVIENFSKQTSTYHSRDEAVPSFEMPAIIICYNMGYNASKTVEYNISSAWDFLTEGKYASDQPPWQVYQDVAYKLNQDFRIVIQFYEQDKLYSKTLHLGRNELIGLKETHWADVQAVPTLYQGECIVINSNFQLKKGEYIGFKVISLLSREETKTKPSGITVHFTPKAEWDRVVYDVWIYSYPFTKWFDFTDREKQFIALELEEYVYNTGNTNCPHGCPMTQCQKWEQIRNKNCTVNCVPFLMKSWYPDVEVCQTKKDHFCQAISSFEAMQDVQLEMLQTQNVSCYPKVTQKYSGRSSYTFNNEPKTEGHSLMFYFAFEAMYKKIKEEHVIYDVFGMIGSLGGSLSLFIGFSFFDYGCKMVNKLFNHCQKPT